MNPAAPDCDVRALWGRDGGVRVVSRNVTFDAEGHTRRSPTASRPSALELLVGALAADLLAGLAREAARAGVALHDAEARLSVRLDNPLVALGVVGETGSAGIADVQGTVAVSSDADVSSLHTLWERARDRAPVYATLTRCATVRIALQPIP